MEHNHSHIKDINLGNAFKIGISNSSYHLLIDSVNLALDAVPENVDIEAVRNYLTSLPAVSDIHDLHIWALSTTDAALTVHLTTNTQTDVSFITNIQHQLHEQFNIEHATIQVEFGDTACGINCKLKSVN